VFLADSNAWVDREWQKVAWYFIESNLQAAANSGCSPPCWVVVAYAARKELPAVEAGDRADGEYPHFSMAVSVPVACVA
jgi:hypothetical protein